MQVARMSDIVIGICYGHIPHRSMTGIIVQASSDVFANDLGVARNGDIVITNCNHTGIIITFSADVLANELGVARVSDLVTGTFRGMINTGSSNVEADTQ